MDIEKCLREDLKTKLFRVGRNVDRMHLFLFGLIVHMLFAVRITSGRDATKKVGVGRLVAHGGSLMCASEGDCCGRILRLWMYITVMAKDS